LIDTHAHLDLLDDADAALARAGDAGVTRVLTIGTAQAVGLAATHEGVYAVVGVDPHAAAGPVDLDGLRELLAHPKAVAVGEIGLDYYRDTAPRAAQQELFAAQLDLAAEVAKPVVIHTRDAEDDTERMLRRHDGTVVLHCFSSPRLLPAALEHGWYVSFAGNATFPKAVDLRLAAREVPADRILAETDSPYLAPQPVRGRPNEPAYVVHTLAALATARDEDADELASRIDANASACFGLRT